MNRYFLLWVLGLVVIAGCSNERVEQLPMDESLTVSERINKFVVEGVKTHYLWEETIDWSLYYNNETYAAYTKHEVLFDKLKHENDRWSSLSEDIKGLEDEFSGVSTTFGYVLAGYYHPYAGNKEVIAVVLYTSAGSPAAAAGLKRGDVIVEMNGGKITEDNYRNLYYASSLTVRRGMLDAEAQTITTLPGTISMTAVEMYENPVNTYKIIEKGTHKIGYLCYTGYQIESESELVRVFSGFKSAGVTDVVLDLRYNSGGYARTALVLSSILAPKAVVERKDVYLKHRYNHFYTTYYESKGDDMKDRFTDTLPVNMNLDRLYVLTSEKTASASEATMVGLAPYLNVIQIGSTTSGKYCGGILLSPEDLYGKNYQDYYSGFANWGMYIMIYRYVNANGVTSFVDGLVPDIQAHEEIYNLKPFGVEDDPLLARALAHIQGQTYAEKRSSDISPQLVPLPDIRRFAGGMLIEEPSLPVLIEP